MAASDEGRRELAAICAAYLREHKPQTTVSEVEAVPYDERAEQRPGAGFRRRRRPARRRTPAPTPQGGEAAAAARRPRLAAPSGLFA